MQKETRSLWRQVMFIGLLGGATTLTLALVGMVEILNRRDIITGVLGLGQSLLLVAVLYFSSLAANRLRARGAPATIQGGILAGLFTSIPLVLLVLVGQVVNLRPVLVNASPVLYKMLLFSQPLSTGLLLLLGAGVLLGGLTAVVAVLPQRFSRPITMGVTVMLLAGLFAETMLPIFDQLGMPNSLVKMMFTSRGLTGQGALAWLVLAALISAAWAPVLHPMQARVKSLPPAQHRVLRILRLIVVALILVALPWVIGRFLSNALVMVGMYALMGWGLNLELGWAGLLDLGFVAFFAIGAYTVALLTSPVVGLASLSFWAALPIAIITALLAGVILGVPVLGVRGDYLAIATLGFGEIVRLLVQSDLLKPLAGGAQGRSGIVRPEIGEFVLNTPEHFYYLVLAACIISLFFVSRLRGSRLGRAWRAVREDEDVAQAMGINLVQTKLLAYGFGAALAGIAGAVFGSYLGSIYPASFQLLVSINVLALIIVGGIGSLPGVFVGALALVGLPELLREFQEFRLLVYGALLIVMMLVRPEGFLPERYARRTLSRAAQTMDVPVTTPGVAASGKGG